jgi:hypothetical protein
MSAECSKHGTDLPTHVVCEGGWWPPGRGEGPNWTYEPTTLVVSFDGEAIDVCLAADGRGGQKVGLASIPVAAIAEALARPE